MAWKKWPLILLAGLCVFTISLAHAQPVPLAHAQPAPLAHAQQPNTATQTVDVMNKLWGKHPGMRANHAKGVVVEGNFTPSLAAAGLSSASIFSGKPVPVTVRFSDSTGIPTLPDGAGAANPHGMAIKFHTAEGGVVDVVTNSLAFFPVATGEDFLALLTALATSNSASPKPTPAEQFIAAHPSVPAAFASASTPTSFAQEVYNGVDAFVFVNFAGERQPFRFKIVPVDGPRHLSAAGAAKLPVDYLVNELPKRLARQKVEFHLTAQLANPGDQTKDPSQPWPADRKMVDMGTITLTKVAADNLKAQHDLRFLPTQLSPGIEVSDDPLITARVQAYVVSFGRRAQ